MNKLPRLTAAFWTQKIAATTLGETAGDLLSMTLGLGYAASSALLLTGFAAVLLLQLRSRSYRPAIYWTVILATSTGGTTLSDLMDRTLGLGYPAGAAMLLSALALLFAAWRATGEPLSVDGAMTRRSELFYWATILISNTLGTAVGDFLADSSGLGFAGGALLVGALLAAVLVLYAATAASRVGLFWAAFVLTRPFGAQVGDVLTKSHEKGGLDLGTVGSSAVLLGVLLALVVREERERVSAEA